MGTPPLDTRLPPLIWQYHREGGSIGEIRRSIYRNHGLKVSHGSVFNVLQGDVPALMYQAPGIRSNKKRGKLNWEEWSDNLEKLQGLKHKASSSQDRAFIELGDGNSPVALGTFSDQHIGSWGCDYKLLRKITHEIINTPNFFIAATGDEGQYSIKLRSVLEMADNIVPPEIQTQIIEDWWDDIWHKVAFATWDNHGVERQEKQAGESSLKKTKSKRVVYFNGIGHVDIKVGDQIYRGCTSHKFRGNSMLNPCHAIMRYMRFEGTDREFGMMGDTHVPGMIKYPDGDKLRVALNSGSLQSNSGFGKRYFSLTTHPAYPIVVLHPKEHLIIPFWSLKEYLEIKKS